MEGLRAVERDVVVVSGDVDAEVLEESFGMISGGGGLDDGGGAVGEESGDEDGAFDLGGGDGEFVVDGLEGGSGDLEGSASRLGAFAVDLCTHLFERGDDAAHGAIGE